MWRVRFSILTTKRWTAAAAAEKRTSGQSTSAKAASNPLPLAWADRDARLIQWYSCRVCHFIFCYQYKQKCLCTINFIFPADFCQYELYTPNLALWLFQSFCPYYTHIISIKSVGLCCWMQLISSSEQKTCQNFLLVTWWCGTVPNVFSCCCSRRGREKGAGKTVKLNNGLTDSIARA